METRLRELEHKNMYDIFNSQGEHIYTAKEILPTSRKPKGGEKREYDVQIVDLNNHEVVLFRRLLGCSWSCCQRCCPAELTVEAPIGNIGRIKQLPACRKLRLRVECPVGNHAATIICPNVCKCIATKDVPYKILDELGNQIGEIKKKRRSTIKAMFTDAEDLRIKFKGSLTIPIKVSLMGALFMVDYLFYEESDGEPKKEKRGCLCFSISTPVIDDMKVYRSGRL